MRKIFSISLPDWILKDIIGESDNRTERIKELIIKGHLSEIKNKAKENIYKFRFSRDLFKMIGIYLRLNWYRIRLKTMI